MRYRLAHLLDDVRGALSRVACRLGHHGPNCAGRTDHIIGGRFVGPRLSRRRARELAAYDRAAGVGARPRVLVPPAERGLRG